MTASTATGTLYLITAALANNTQPSPGARKIRDALLVRTESEWRYIFQYATVVIKSQRYSSVREAVRLIEEFEASKPKLDGVEAAYTWASLRPDGGPQPTEDIVRILLCEPETGSVGHSEREAVFGNTLDFGEHTVVVSPAGMSIAGDVPDQQIEVYFYYAAQIGAAICRYAQNERTLNEVIVDIRARAADFDVEKLQDINVSTSKAMLDISDELLDIPPRENFILRTLLKVANVEVYEQRISRMLNIIQHHVSYRQALVAKRNSERIEFVLFVIAVLSGLGALCQIFGLTQTPWEKSGFGLGLMAGAAVLALIASLLFRGYRRFGSSNNQPPSVS
jgi:hypothetical protein